MSDRPNPRDARDAAEFVRRLKSIDAHREPRDARREPPKSTSPLSVAWRRLAENGPWSFAVAVAAAGSVAVVAGEAGSDTAAALVAAVAAFFASVAEFLAENPVFTAIAGGVFVAALAVNAWRERRGEDRRPPSRRRLDLVSISAAADYRIRRTLNPDEWSPETRSIARKVGLAAACICIAGGFVGFVKALAMTSDPSFGVSGGRVDSLDRGLLRLIDSAWNRLAHDPATMVVVVAVMFGLTGLIIAIRVAGRR